MTNLHEDMKCDEFDTFGSVSNIPKPTTIDTVCPELQPVYFTASRDIVLTIKVSSNILSLQPTTTEAALEALSCNFCIVLVDTNEIERYDEDAEPRR